jgi:hypothetical protein
LNRQFANHVKTVFSNINFSSLFEAVWMMQIIFRGVIFWFNFCFLNV